MGASGGIRRLAGFSEVRVRSSAGSLHKIHQSAECKPRPELQPAKLTCVARGPVQCACAQFPCMSCADQPSSGRSDRLMRVTIASQGRLSASG